MQFEKLLQTCEKSVEIIDGRFEVLDAILCLLVAS